MSASSRATIRGQPLIALVTVMVSWIALRIAVYDPMIEPQLYAKRDMAIEPRSQLVKAIAQSSRKAPLQSKFFGGEQGNVAAPDRKERVAPQFLTGRTVSPMPSLKSCEEEASCGQVRERLSPWPVLRDNGIGNARAPDRVRLGNQRTWSIDAWLLVRPDAVRSNSSGFGASAYGGSQTGAVLRFAMDSESSRRPFAYVRAVKSLDDREDGHLGVGMAARPIGGVPINVHLEGRVYLSAGSQQIAPAAFVSGGIDDVVPKLGASVRGYAQAGYVGGQPDTQFVDGNLVLGKKIPVGLNSAMAIGAGVWGGAEKNVARLELGPSADVVFPLGSGFGRLEASYRWRVGEEDTKDAGAAVLTLSAGF